MIDTDKNSRNYFLYVCFGIGLYIATLCSLKFRLFDSLKLGLRDLSIFDQAIWNLFNNGTLYSSLIGENLLGEHTSFILFLVAPFYMVHFGPKTLLFLESCFLGLGALPVYFIACREFKQKSIGMIFAISYLLFPSTGFLNMDGVKYGFHPDAFLPVLYLSMFYFLVAGKKVQCLFFALLTLSVKEDTALIVCLTGIYSLVFLKKIRLGSIIIFLSVIWFFFTTKIIIPGFHGGPSKFLTNYNYIGNNLWEIIKILLLNPLYFLSLLRENGIFTYSFVLLAPFAFLPFLSPEILFIAIPTLLMNLLSDPAKYVVPHSPVSWHIASLIPFVVLSSIYGTKRLCRFFKKGSLRITGKMNLFYAVFPVMLMALTVMCSHLFYGVTPLSMSFWGVKYFPLSRYPLSSDLYKRTIYNHTETEKLIPEIKNLIPASASLSVTFFIGTHFAHRRQLYWFPKKSYDAEYILIDSLHALNKDEARKFINKRDKKHELIYCKDHVFLYRKL